MESNSGSGSADRMRGARQRAQPSLELGHLALGIEPRAESGQCAGACESGRRFHAAPGLRGRRAGIRKAVELEGLNEISGGNLATAYECAGQNDLALDTYKSLVAVHPDAAAWTRIGYLEALKERVAGSLAAFENALRLDPNNSVAYSYRGTGRLALGDMAGARSDFQRALALDPGNAVAAGGLSRIPPGK